MTGLVELWPDPRTVDDPTRANAMAVRTIPENRPWVAMVMISSLDGAAEVDGRSGGLGGPSDKAVFGSMRAMADVILAGASTVRTENYGPIPVRAATERQQRGQHPSARLAVLSRSLNFSADSRLLTEPGHQEPLIYTTARPTADQQRLLEGAELVVLEDTGPLAVLADLRERGAEVVVLEGGPMVNAQFLEADAVDEINLSLAPWAAAGDAIRIAHGEARIAPRAFSLERVWMGDGIVFTRHVRDRAHQQD